MRKEPKSEIVPTQLTKFPCPKCGKYYEPYMTRKDGKAMLECPTDGLYETSIAVSKNFRKFCAKLGSAPNRDPHYYTSAEEKVRKYLVQKGLVEGLNFTHNTRLGPYVNGNKHRTYYWADFIVPEAKLVIECSPSIWHTRWNREGADKRKTDFLRIQRWDLISLDEKELSKINKNRIDRFLKLRTLDVKLSHSNWNEWLAALFLGEGSIQIARMKTKRGGHQFNLTVRIYNTDEEIINKVIELTNWYKRSDPYVRRGKNLIAFTAYTGGWRLVLRFFQEIYPFTVGKKRRGIELIMELYRMRKCHKYLPYAREELRKYGEIRRTLMKPSHQVEKIIFKNLEKGET